MEKPLVSVCPHCNFITVKSDIESLQKTDEELSNSVSDGWKILNFVNGLRTAQMAMAFVHAQGSEMRAHGWTMELEPDIRLVPPAYVIQSFKLLKQAIDTIEGLSDQQAMPDDFYQPVLNSIKEFLNSLPPDFIKE